MSVSLNDCNKPINQLSTPTIVAYLIERIEFTQKLGDCSESDLRQLRKLLDRELRERKKQR